MNIAYLSLGIKMQLVLVNIESLKYIGEYDAEYETNWKAPLQLDGLLNHAMVRYNGVIIEPYTGKVYSGAVHYSFSFDEVFNN